jgi:sugar-specific transcriptional regulator TrmB
VLKILENFGLAREDAEVYIYLAKKGPKRVIDLSSSLKMTDQQLFLSLKNLQSKGIITVNIKKTALFSAVTFERVLDLFVESFVEQACVLTETREELLANWRSMTKQNEI